MKRSNWFVPVVFAIGIAIIALSLWAPENKLNFGFNQKAFATVIERDGIVKLQNNEMPAEIQINSNYKVEPLDVVRTETASEAVIEFQNGGQFRLAEKTEVVVDLLDNGSPMVLIRTGEIFIEKFGKSPGYWVRTDGQLYSASDYVLLDRKSASKLEEPLPSAITQDQISQVEIENILNSKKNDFFKCFGQLIQKLPQASGQVLVTFTIEKHGQTTQVEVSKSDIIDTQFKSCLVEVVARTKFRSFNGSPITTVFPLNFE